MTLLKSVLGRVVSPKMYVLLEVNNLDKLLLIHAFLGNASPQQKQKQKPAHEAQTVCPAQMALAKAEFVCASRKPALSWAKAVVLGLTVVG